MLARVALLIVAVSGCATAPCAVVVKQDATPAERERAAQEQAKCEQRVKRMRGTLDEQQEAREAEQRRDAFRGRSDAKAHGH
jgi:hypothetical protein